jgi:hypothetical protein
MTNIALFRPVEHTGPTVMETIMKPLSLARRSARWLAAAGIALACLTATPASALEELVIDEEPRLELDEPGGPEIDAVAPRPFFEKIGAQRDCNYVTYTLRFGFRGAPAAFASPGFGALIASVRFDFSDQMPNGLTVVDVTAAGDGTMGGGGALAPSIGTSADPNDTAKLDDFRLSATDLDGSGEAGQRFITIKITARIDPGAFPGPSVVENQGWVRVARDGGPIDIPSHDPSIPDDADFRTGEKTKILVDLSGCEPPPPPPGGGEEPCFQVVTGEVDCVPGGGAFIYSMPFGADMAGRIVQLKTTTPGIIIDPASQLVPAGGGVLAWTITGALPGDVIHLIVVGVEPYAGLIIVGAETYAGSAEGWGICCTQTIDLVIPADIDCPDDPRKPDIQVEKVADVPFCTKEGGCDFTIRVKNVGDGPYNGAIVLDEVTFPGSATVSSGPNAPWTCLPMASPMSCEHPATTLDPGEEIELKLGFTPGPAWDWGAIRNCAEYDYAASGKGPFGLSTNDKACASIPICIPGRDRECTPPNDEPKVDLTIRKIATPVMCTEDGVCTYQIAIINPTAETFTGPLTVIDEFPTHPPVSVNIEPTGPWACVPESGIRFRCDHPGLVLVGGAVTILTVQAVVADYPTNEVENCGEIVPFPGESDTTNNKSCAIATLPNPQGGKPVLRITKTCDGAVAGAAISCRITVISLGDVAPSGPVRVSDAAELIGAGTPVQIQTVSPDGPEWACGPVPADALSCQIPGAVMTPGTSRHFDVTLSVSPNQRFENCARGSFGPAPGDDIVYPFGEACDQGGATMAVEKTGDVQCTVGQPCTFEITIKNESDTDFTGNMRIGDAMQIDGFGRLEGVAIAEIVPPFGCSPEPATLPLSCEANLSLGAGESRVHQVTIVIPDDGRFDDLTGPVGGQNCVAVLSPDAPVAGRKTDGRVLEIDPDALGGTYACHSFELIKQEQSNQEQVNECSPGFVLNANGRCVCPEGSTFRNGKCTGQGGTPAPRPQSEPEQCTLLPGMIRTKNGNCVCPKGTELKSGACRKIVTEQPPTRQCKLLPGQIRTKDGQCVCPRGTKLVRGQCQKVEQPVVCKKGEVLRNGKCVTIQIQRRCPQGFQGTPPNCRPITQRVPNLQLNPDVLKKLIPPRRQGTTGGNDQGTTRKQ